MRVYTTGRMLIDAGVIGDGADWTPEAAYTKLCWVLSQTKEHKKVEKMMMENIAGEISDVSLVKEQE
jgi:glutamyl-tRNA(Gln) amidotransferase subunit D